MTPPSSADARRWLQRFEAVEAVQRAERRKIYSAAESIRLSLSLIEMMFTLAGGRLPTDPLREHEAAAVRGVWARLRRASGYQRD